MPTKSVSLNCPSCRKLAGVINIGTVAYICLHCTRTWTTKTAYDTSLTLLGDPADDAVAEPVEPDYIESGLKNDLNDLVRQAQVHVLELVRSQLSILDWNKSGAIETTEMDLYLQRMVNDLKDGRLQ